LEAIILISTAPAGIAGMMAAERISVLKRRVSIGRLRRILSDHATEGRAGTMCAAWEWLSISRPIM
jgi:hypothetical protein